MKRIASLVLAFVLGSSVALAQHTNYFTFSTDALSNSAVTVKNGPGTLVAFECFNPNAAAAYLQIFNSLTAVVGTATPVATPWLVPPGTTTGMTAPYSDGRAYSASTGLQAAATTTPTGAVAPASALSCDFFYH